MTLSHVFEGWFRLEGKMMLQGMHKKPRPYFCYSGPSKRPGGEAFMTHAFFPLPQLPKDRVVLAGVTFDPEYLRKTFFPEVLEQMIARKATEERGNRLAMMVYPAESEGGDPSKVLAASTGWSEGKPEVSRNLGDVFRGLTLGIKFQGTSAETIARRWAMQSFLILLVLSVAMIGGLALTYHNVSKELALARLKSDFVSNVSHELRTPLALIRLYAETLELGRIKGREKAETYYRIIRKESERLTALINNILDFSRIEAGAKQYDFRETDIAGSGEKYARSVSLPDRATGLCVRAEHRLHRSLLACGPGSDRTRAAQPREQCSEIFSGQEIPECPIIPRERCSKTRSDRSRHRITRREQAKIFEKFYRTGDALVHNTKGSGLGLALVRHITRAHGGEISVESTPGEGSKFTLSLPLQGATQPHTNCTGATAS